MKTNMLLGEWADRSQSELVDHIVTFYHDRLRLMLPELLLLAKKVEDVHSDHKYCPRGTAFILKEINIELLFHMKKEEHNTHGNNLANLRRLAFDFNPPVDACGTWRAFYKGLDQLEQELMEHISLENNFLFMRALLS